MLSEFCQFGIRISWINGKKSMRFQQSFSNGYGIQYPGCLNGQICRNLSICNNSFDFDDIILTAICGLFAATVVFKSIEQINRNQLLSAVVQRSNQSGSGNQNQCDQYEVKYFLHELQRYDKDINRAWNVACLKDWTFRLIPLVSENNVDFYKSVSF